MSGVRFTVTKAGNGETGGESSTDPPHYGASEGVPQVRIVDSEGKDGENRNSNENSPLTENAEGNRELTNMALYEEELHHRPMLSRFLSGVANYEGGMEPNTEQEGHDDDTKSKKDSKAGKLGTVLGVYFPCIQNIFGVILFIRLVWIVGSAGWLEAFFIVFICCCTTLTTAISMSAIATNGVVPAGGSYFLISRALGPEFGGAVGILFYLGTSVASSMYIVGAVEILLNYIAPAMVLPLGGVGPDITDSNTAFNNYRVYGTILMIIMAIWVFLGVKFVSMFSPIALTCVILSILAIYVGIFVANPERGLEVCMIGGKILKESAIMTGGELYCNKWENSTIYNEYCGGNNGTELTDKCRWFLDDANEIGWERAIPGLSSGVIMDNIFNQYTETGDAVGKPGVTGLITGEISADISTSFIMLLAIFFPSCTGIMAGSNRSGDLADASKSIPTGTIAAILTTSFVYLSSVVFFGATINGQVLRDKFGESIGGKLIIAELCWPNPWVILIGSFLSTVGAGLQSLTGAPRLLQAIAADGVIPFINVFSVTTKRGEPLRALILTACIGELGVLVASLDYIAPIITMFFLMCYGFVNLACAVQTLLRTPNWRPRFKYYHWVLSLFGVGLCLTIMFISSWYYALMAIAIAAGIYKYVEYKGAEKEWGDGIRGLAMSAARYALLRLEEGPPHVKNWRPQCLVLMKAHEDLTPKHRKMLSFASQLKAGKGLTLVGTVLEGELKDKYADSQAMHQSVTALMKKEKVKGFSDVLVANNVPNGIATLIQTMGVGGLRHNTVLLGWPYQWRKNPNEGAWRVFIDTLHNVSATQLAALIPKGIDQFPENNEKMSGTIDIWWIVHDGGLLMLLPFLLEQHKVWKHCKMRIFTVAQMEDNSIQMKRDLKTFLYHLRLTADVEVVEMPDSDISAYTYERTLMMEQRSEIVKEMRLKKKDLTNLPQSIVDKAHSERRSSTGSPPGGLPAVHPASVQITVDDVIPEHPAENAGEVVSGLHVGHSESNQFTFTPGMGNGKAPSKQDDSLNTSSLLNIKPGGLQVVDDRNVRRMHTAVKLNEVIVAKSHDAKLVIINLPGPPKNRSAEQNYMEYLEVLTEGLERVLMVRGGGREVITIYS